MNPVLCADSLSRGWRRIPSPPKLAFLASFSVGLLVYLFALTNVFLCTSDALTNTVFNGNLTWLGRWSSHWLSGLGTNQSIPLINGLLTLFAISLLSAFAVAYLELRSRICAVLAGMALICYPSVGNTIIYLHNVDGYMIAAMLAVASLFILDRFRFGMVFSIPMLAVAVGTYQANMSLVISLMLVRAVSLIVSGSRDDRALVRLALRYVLAAAASLALYYALAIAFARMYGLQLSDYQNVSGMSSFTLSRLARNFAGCYRDFKKELTYLSFRPGYYVLGYPNYLYFLASWGLAAASFWLCGQRSALKRIALCALFLLSPMLFCSIRMFGPDSVHSLMTYSVSGLYLLGISMMDGLPEKLACLKARKCKRPRARQLMRAAICAASWALTICLIVCCFVWSVGINIDYYNGSLEYDNMYELCGEFLSLAEKTAGYEKSMPIYVIGSLAGSGSSRADPLLSMPKHYYAFMVFYLGVRMPYAIANDIDDAAERASQTRDFADMPSYPGIGCTRVIDGALVVKLSETRQ